MGRFDRLDKMVRRKSAPEKAGADEGEAGEAHEQAPDPERRVLLVSRLRDWREGLVQVLESEHCEVKAVDNRQAFEAIVGSQKFDLVLAGHDMGDARDLEGRTRATNPGAEFRRLPPLSTEILSQVVAYRPMLELFQRGVELMLGVLVQDGVGHTERARKVAEEVRGIGEALGLVSADLDALGVAAHLLVLDRLLAVREEGGVPGAYIEDLVDRLDAPYPLREILLPPADDPGPSASALAAAEFIVEARDVARSDAEIVKALREGLGGRVAPVAAEMAISLLASAGGEAIATMDRTLLLADADRAASDLLELRLRNEGFRVVRYTDGQTALEACADLMPDLALVEVSLPRLDGYTLLDRMKSAVGTANVPVILLAARSDAMTVNRGLMLGAEDVLTKPIDVVTLLTKIDRILGLVERDPERIARRGAELAELEGAAPAGQTGEELPVVEVEHRSADTLKAGDVLGERFKLLALVGSGGMGSVFKALDKALEEVVALKVLRDRGLEDSDVAEQRFKQEIKLARRITHPHVVRIFDFMELEGIQIISMEYVEGITLKQLIQDKGAVELGFGLRVMLQVCAALTSAHALNVVHRDIKPHNVLINDQGVAKVLDFGIARMQNAQGLTRDGRSFGTPEYMSPEQIMGKPQDHRTDIYSLGCMMYEAFTGFTVFPVDSAMSVAMKQVQDEPELPRVKNPNLPEALELILVKMLNKNPELRYQTARELDATVRAAFAKPPRPPPA